MVKQQGGRETLSEGASQGASREKLGDSEALATHTAAILGAIRDTKTTLEAQIVTLAGDMGLLREDQRKLEDLMKETEDTLETTVPQVKHLNQGITFMGKEMWTLAIKLEDASSRSKHHNMPLVGVPEKLEGPSLELYIEDWLAEWYSVGGSPLEILCGICSQNSGNAPATWGTPSPHHCTTDELSKPGCDSPDGEEKQLL
ncbi:hypothetical protein NDU88_002032 [Pleurodeles waltl]|uniref:t-SNARE coiled-coil homology domain-containing protein n=1 Tax=Pleurodeles waltl TaxID=8319 RepID=A0AAV7TK11_PLEWA|nr:hypothetical protein NDU88_002032 [Pleurodeles waltl]